MRGLRVVVAVLVLATVAAGVGAADAGAATVSTATARTEIEQLVSQTYPGLAAGAVGCPARVERRSGTSFSCTVQLPGGFLVVDATQEGRGTVTLRSPQAVLTKPGLEQLVAANASIAATVDCGPAPFVVRRPGQTVTCSAALADGTTRSVQLTVRDTAGTVAVTSVS